MHAPGLSGRCFAAPVAAKDESSARSDDAVEKPRDERSPPLLRDVDELRSDEVEAPRRVPGERVAYEDPVGPPRHAAPLELRERRHQLEPVRLDSARMCPFDHALEQMTARATDVEKRPVLVDGIRNRPSPDLPARGVAAESGLRSRIVRQRYAASSIAAIRANQPASSISPRARAASSASTSRCHGRVFRSSPADTLVVL